MPREERPSFSAARKWSISLNVALGFIALVAIVVMVNYLGARHFGRFAVSRKAQAIFSPLTRNVLSSITNDVKVIVYFDQTEAIYESVWSLLKEYKYANSRINVEAIDPERDPAAAQVLQAKYKFPSRNLVYFECNGRPKIVMESELSDVDVKPLLSGKKDVRRTAFKGEMMFTSALLSVTTSKPLKAYFLLGHGEHSPASDDKLMGYSKFADVLRENNIQYDVITNGLVGNVEIPVDCHLLIIAGPKDSLLQVELEKIDRYLSQGGRLFMLFSFHSLKNPDRATGLEKILANWGVLVGGDVVADEINRIREYDVIVNQFGSHPLIKPLHQDRRLYMLLPRSVQKAPNRSTTADAPQVEILATTGDQGRIQTDIRNGVPSPRANDYRGAVPLMAAVEKGSLKGVKDRGATRILVVGDSIFLGNETLDKLGNHDFASLALNWLLARNELLVNLPPRPITEYKLDMTETQRFRAGWVLLAGMPGGVLLLGSLVWLRRRS